MMVMLRLLLQHIMLAVVQYRSMEECLPYEETLNYIIKINDILGGALANDSTTVDGAYATDFYCSF